MTQMGARALCVLSNVQPIQFTLWMVSDEGIFWLARNKGAGTGTRTGPLADPQISSLR